ncbi:MAG TPA: glycosyltransferase family 9 protein [Jatrophihabitans sp.]|nr:glycosyltransferase family 9 protein [Jatrophihabitans sp.]
MAVVMTGRVLVVRLDSMGDMLVCGPAIRAVAAAAPVTVLAGPAGRAAAELLPGVGAVLEWDCPWISADPAPVTAKDCDEIVARLRCERFDAALILTSFHQSALPTALLLRLAGIARIAAVSTDYPGSLLDVRIPEPPDGPEPQRMLAVAEAAGYLRAPDDGGELQVLPPPVTGLPGPYLVVHPGAAAPARTCSPANWQHIVAGLLGDGHRVVLTGAAGDADWGAGLPATTDLTGRLRLAELAGVLAGAAAVVVGNTGPAHLAAAVGTPVVSLFAPVVPAVRWAPYTPARVVLTDPEAACAGSRARTCPVPGHPCLDRITPAQVLSALAELGVAAPAVIG